MDVGDCLLAMNDFLMRILNPKKFFESLKERKGIKSDFILLTLILTIFSAPGAFLISLLVFLSSGLIGALANFIIILASAVLLKLTVFFILALLLHFAVKLLFKVESNLVSIYIGVIYSSIPYSFYSFILSGIPFLDILAYLIFAYVLWIGFSVLYGMSPIKSLVLAALSVLIFVLLTALSALLLLLMLNILKFGSLSTQSSDEAQSLFNAAVSANNQSLCEEIHPSHEQRDNCFFKVAGNTNNSSLCEKINWGNLKDACELHIASSTRNTSLCEKINSQILKDSCMSMATRH